MIQPLSFFGYFLPYGFIFGTGKHFHIQVNRMQCKSRNRCIRIRICPAMCSRCIVHRQQLYQFQAGSTCPVDQQFQVGKLSYSQALLTAQAEHRNSNACTLPGIIGQYGEPIIHCHLPVFGAGVVQGPVVAVFIQQENIFLSIVYTILVSNRERRVAQIERCCKAILPFLPVHQYRCNSIPIPQFNSIAQYAEGLAGLQERTLYHQHMRCFSNMIAFYSCMVVFQ